MAAFAPPAPELEIPVVFYLACMFAYPLAVLFGLPLLLVYRRYRIEGLAAFAIGGFTIGALFALLAITPVIFWVSTGLAGLVGASFFWATAVRPIRHAD